METNGLAQKPKNSKPFLGTKQQNNNKQTKKTQGKQNKKIKTGNNSTYHEPLSEEWIGRRS